MGIETSGASPIASWGCCRCCCVEGGLGEKSQCLNTAVSDSNNLALITAVPAPGSLHARDIPSRTSCCHWAMAGPVPCAQHHALGNEWAGGCEKQPALCVQAYRSPFSGAEFTPREARAAEGRSGAGLQPSLSSYMLASSSDSLHLAL